MRVDEIDKAMEFVGRKSSFYCSKVSTSQDLIVYSAEKTVFVRNSRQNVLIDINFYPEYNTVVLIMNISKGYWGSKRDRVGELLLNMNSITRIGTFAVWQQTGNIIFKNDVPLEYLDPYRLITYLDYFEIVYIGTKPVIESFAKQLDLRYMTEEEHGQLSSDLEKFYHIVQNKLPG